MIKQDSDEKRFTNTIGDIYYVIPRKIGSNINNTILSRAREICEDYSISFTDAVCIATQEILK